MTVRPYAHVTTVLICILIGKHKFKLSSVLFRPMPFPFTFIFNVPGTINPFSTYVGASPQPRRFHPPSPSPSPTPTPLSRKRRWQPSLAEPSRSTTTITSTTGYLDTPSGQSLVMGSALSGTSNSHLPSNDQYDEGKHSLSISLALASFIAGCTAHTCLALVKHAQVIIKR